MISEDIQRLAPGNLIELYILDMSAIGADILHFHPGTNGLNSSITWQGVVYVPFPMEITGFEASSKGTLPRPMARVSNTAGLIGAYCRTYEDLVGAKLTRKRTFAKYLDAVNFSGSVNLTADPSVEFANDVFFVDRKATENRQMVEFELAAAFDVQGERLPRRQFTSVCRWLYRGPECGYTGGAVAQQDNTPTTDPTLDKCSQSTTGCKLRWGANNPLPSGGFPAVGLVQ